MTMAGDSGCPDWTETDRFLHFWTRVGEFGTVTPRVQIPGPRPKSEYDSGATAGGGRAPYHSRITISRGGLPALRQGARMSRPNVEPGLLSALDPPNSGSE